MWNSSSQPYQVLTLQVSGCGSNGNEGVLHILPELQDWSLTIMLFSVTSWTVGGGEGRYSSAEMQLVHSWAPADWVK